LKDNIVLGWKEIVEEYIIRHADQIRKTTRPLMTWPVPPMAPLKFDSRPDIRPADMRIFHHITSIAFQFDEVMQERYAALVDKINSENYLIHLDGKPVGTGLLFSTGGIGGIFNIGILPEYEGKGCARAMMQFLKYRAYQIGLKRFLLLGSPVAEALYTDLEFKKAFDIEIYTQED
jgi:GNAT superfamily N-acetyltransferase